ncbi:MAG: alpha/beta hydrolase fold protein [Myxococcales bacterium]|nr:alpha/beta hydrolase fold protein [Myxococcales bacterium]
MAKLWRRPPPPFSDPVLQEDVPVCGGLARAFRFRSGVVARQHAVLCIAGMGANGRSFARQEPLAERWPFVLLNTPNETPAHVDPIEYAADAVEAYLDRERLEQPILLASSFGGAVAARVALRRPQRIGALIMADAVVSRRQIPLAFPGFVDLLNAPDWLARLVSPMAVQIMGGFHLDPPARDEIVRESRVFESRELKRRLSALLRVDLLPELERLRIPSLCIHGSRDLLVPWRRGRWLADALEGVFVLIRGAGHLPYLTHAAEFNARLSRFLETFDL